VDDSLKSFSLHAEESAQSPGEELCVEGAENVTMDCFLSQVATSAFPAFFFFFFLGPAYCSDPGLERGNDPN
jgi:hypothetical protein